MLFCRVRMHAGLWVAGLWVMAGLLQLCGCSSTPRGLEPSLREDDFGVAEQDITAESVQLEEMLHQRAQLELRGGGAFPFDVFDPSEDADSDEAFTLGFKFAFETYKNVFFGVTFDWANHSVVDAADPLLRKPIQSIDSYDRFNLLLNGDYDIPLWDAPDALVLRAGFGVGAMMVSPEARVSRREIETVYQVVFRPAVGLRYPVDENFVAFLELSHDFVPERTLLTTDGERVSGEHPIFDVGRVLVGIAFQW